MNEKARFDFWGHRKLYFGISIAVIVVGIIASILVGPKLDVQFAGGSMIKYSVDGDVNADGVQKTIKEKLDKDCTVAVNEEIGSDSRFVTISFAGNKSMTPDEQKEVATTLTEAYDELTFEMVESNSVDATMGAKFFLKCLVCFAITAAFLLLYIALRFRKIGGLSAGLTAVVALLHDVVISFCVFVIFGMPVNDIFIAVVLTILGYSLNSTIVIYDRVRENKRVLGPRAEFTHVMNLSLNQTLGRTLITSLTTFLAVLVVLVVAFIFDISTVVSFALPMMVGIVAGCFSSQCIAPNLYAMWQVHKRDKLNAGGNKKK